MSSAVPMEVQTFMGKVVDAIINPILAILFAVALLYFLFGLMHFIFSAADVSKREQGKQHMLWGIIGMAVMVSAYGLIAMGLATVGVTSADLPNTLPF